MMKHLSNTTKFAAVTSVLGLSLVGCETTTGPVTSPVNTPAPVVVRPTPAARPAETGNTLSVATPTGAAPAPAPAPVPPAPAAAPATAAPSVPPLSAPPARSY